MSASSSKKFKKYKKIEKDLDTELKNLKNLKKVKIPNPTAISASKKRINKLNNDLKEIAEELYPIPVRTFDQLKNESRALIQGPHVNKFSHRSDLAFTVDMVNSQHMFLPEVDIFIQRSKEPYKPIYKFREVNLQNTTFNEDGSITFRKTNGEHVTDVNDTELSIDQKLFANGCKIKIVMAQTPFNDGVSLCMYSSQYDSLSELNITTSTILRDDVLFHEFVNIWSDGWYHLLSNFDPAQLYISNNDPTLNSNIRRGYTETYNIRHSMSIFTEKRINNTGLFYIFYEQLEKNGFKQIHISFNGKKFYIDKLSETEISVRNKSTVTIIYKTKTFSDYEIQDATGGGFSALVNAPSKDAWNGISVSRQHFIASMQCGIWGSGDMRERMLYLFDIKSFLNNVFTLPKFKHIIENKLDSMGLNDEILTFFIHLDNFAKALSKLPVGTRENYGEPNSVADGQNSILSSPSTKYGFYYTGLFKESLERMKDYNPGLHEWFLNVLFPSKKGNPYPRMDKKTPVENLAPLCATNGTTSLLMSSWGIADIYKTVGFQYTKWIKEKNSSVDDPKFFNMNYLYIGANLTTLLLEFTLMSLSSIIAQYKEVKPTLAKLTERTSLKDITIDVLSDTLLKAYDVTGIQGSDMLFKLYVEQYSLDPASIEEYENQYRTHRLVDHIINTIHINEPDDEDDSAKYKRLIEPFKQLRKYKQYNDAVNEMDDGDDKIWATEFLKLAVEEPDTDFEVTDNQLRNAVDVKIQNKLQSLIASSDRIGIVAYANLIQPQFIKFINSLEDHDSFFEYIANPEQFYDVRKFYSEHGYYYKMKNFIQGNIHECDKKLKDNKNDTEQLKKITCIRSCILLDTRYKYL